MRFGFIAKYRSVWPVQWLCAALDVTCAGFYAWLKRPQSTRASVDAMLGAAIQRSFSDSDRTYGARRVRRDLLDWGHRCGIHRVERLMRRSQLVARRRRRRMPFDVGPRHSMPRTSWSGDLMRLWSTANGSQISPTCGPRRAGCM